MPESLVDIRGATQTYSLPPEVECFAPVHEQGINNKRVSYRTSTLFIGTSFIKQHCNIRHSLGCKYSFQNLINAKNFNSHKSQFLCIIWPPCTQSMHWKLGGQLQVLPLSLSGLGRVLNIRVLENQYPNSTWVQCFSIFMFTILGKMSTRPSPDHCVLLQISTEFPIRLKYH